MFVYISMYVIFYFYFYFFLLSRGLLCSFALKFCQLKVSSGADIFCQLKVSLAPLRRQWHPTPVLLPGKSHGQRSLVGCNPWGHYQLDTSLSLFTFMHWRRKWQPTPVFLPGESQGRGSLVGRRLWGRTESDTTEAT